MSEEIKNEEEKVVETPAAAADVPAEKPAETTAAEPEQPAAEPAQPAVSETQPQIIVQKERGFSHYVGFALLCVLCICFFFMPGIALTFGVSQLVSLNGAAAWIFSAILSFIIWLIFKLKVKGFKKSFYFYIGLCVVVFALLIAIEVLTEKLNVFASIFALLSGAAA
jgi:hypothetical protein